MQGARGWVLVVGLLVIMAAAAFAVISIVKNEADRTLQPFQQGSQAFQAGSQSLQTQVARLLSPTPTVIPDPVTIVRQVSDLARLETIQYTIEKVITAETGQGAFAFLFGDKLIFVAHGTVTAGVDLGKLQPGDITVTNGVVMIHLPAPEVFSAALDNQKSYVYDRTTGVLSHSNNNLETTARQAAEEQIRQAAVDDGILRLAQSNAEAFLTRLLAQLGYKDVQFIETVQFPTEAPTPVG